MATYINLCGFETGDALETEGGSIGGTGGTIQTGIVRTGTYAFRLDGTGWGASGNANVFFGSYGTDGVHAHGTNFTTNYIRFYLYINASSGAMLPILICMNSGFTNTLVIKYDPATSKLKLYDSTNTLQGTASATISTGTWHLIELDGDFSASPSITIRQDTTSVITSSNAAFASKNTCRVYLGTYTAQAAASDVVYDDFAWTSDVAPGAGAVYALYPTGNSATNTGWTASAGNKWACIDELPPNGDTDYITTSTNTDTYTATLTNPTTAGITTVPNAVKALAQAKGNASASLKIRIRSGSTNSDNASAYTGTTYVGIGRVLSVDPTDSAAWSVSKLSSLEVGLIAGNTDIHRCSFAAAMVDVGTTPSGGGIVPITPALLRGNGQANKPNPGPIGPPTRGKTRGRTIGGGRRR